MRKDFRYTLFAVFAVLVVAGLMKAMVIGPAVGPPPAHVLARMCRYNLENIAEVLRVYAQDTGRLPDDHLLLEALQNPELLRCPGNPGLTVGYSFWLYRELPARHVILGTLPVAWDAAPIHDGKMNVVFLNGRVECLSPEEFQGLLDEFGGPNGETGGSLK